MVHAVFPPEGIDWCEVASSRRAERTLTDRMAPVLHPDYESVWPRPEGEPDTVARLSATMLAIRELPSTFARLVAIPERYIELADGRVLVLLRREGLTHAGRPVAQPGASIYEFEDGLVRRVVLYNDRASALAAVGLDRPGELDADEVAGRSPALTG